MYSATFALTIIIVIALTNLFLGFASAVLIGRGPKRWSDVDRAIVLQPFALDLILPHRKSKLERINVGPGKTPVVIPLEPEPPATTPAPTAPTATAPAPTAPPAPAPTAAAATAPPAAAAPAAATPAKRPSTVAAARKNKEPAAPAHTIDGESAPKKFVLPSVSPAQLDDIDSPETLLNRQIDAWRQGDVCDEIPSLSGLTVEICDEGLDESTVSRLLSEIRTRIVRQLRRDRRVLTIASNKFAWFSSDVSPGDALMPIERIRQLLSKTRFHCQGDTIDLTITAGVVSGSEADDATALIKRLQLAMTCARELKESPTYLDEGEGPKSVAPLTLEIEETQCDLAR